MSLPSAGDLDRRVIIKSQEDMPAMGAGVDQQYTPIATVWAKHGPVGNALFFGSKQVDEGVTDRFIVRLSDVVNEKTISGHCVVEMNETLYRIRRASDLEGARIFLMLETERLG